MVLIFQTVQIMIDIISLKTIIFAIDCFMFNRKVIIPTVEGLLYYTLKKTLKTIMMFTKALPVNIYMWGDIQI